MERISLSQGEVLEELRKLLEPGAGPDDAYTVSELVEATGRSPLYIRKQIGILARDGAIESVKVQRTRIDGQPTFVPGYRLKKAA